MSSLRHHWQVSFEEIAIQHARFLHAPILTRNCDGTHLFYYVSAWGVRYEFRLVQRLRYQETRSELINPRKKEILAASIFDEKWHPKICETDCDSKERPVLHLAISIRWYVRPIAYYFPLVKSCWFVWFPHIWDRFCSPYLIFPYRMVCEDLLSPKLPGRWFVRNHRTCKD